jgi:hypothetical protein
MTVTYSFISATGWVYSHLSRSKRRAVSASTASVYFLFTKQMRDSGLPADVLMASSRRTLPSDYT